MSRLATSWHSERLGREVNVVRWGEVGQPVLFFPTAAGDAQECERFQLVDALSDHLAEGRIKLYSVDSVPGMVWLKEDSSVQVGADIQQRYLEFVAHELVPAIRSDCNDDSARVIASGASIGAYEALTASLHYPELFRAAICMSGTYDLSKFLKGPETLELQRVSPLHFLPNLEGEHLAAVKGNFVLLCHGTGRWEDPSESWRVAEALGAKDVPNRVDEWGEQWDHDWPVWRSMLPQYLDELLAGSE
jgi:esterase/lipase superfamily enzyme